MLEERSQFNETPSWQQALSRCISNPEQLLNHLGLSWLMTPHTQKATAQFALRVSHSFMNRMEHGNPHDPLLRQVLPLSEELELITGYGLDPLCELSTNPIPGLLHKYQNRVLLTVSSACGIHCRYCFRRHFSYQKNNPGALGWENALDYISKNKKIDEVILSGGDPLTANDKTLNRLTQQIADISHIKRLRFHTRMPIVIPNRITKELIAAITGTRLQLIMVLHCNHAQEINLDVREAILELKKSNIILLNQSVLLKGVNDQVTTLIALSEALFMVGVQPYYLNLLDKVQGTAHFDVDITTAKNLIIEMSANTSGYLVPKLVTEQPGARSKKVVA